MYRLPLRVISGPFHFVSRHVLMNVQFVLYMHCACKAVSIIIVLRDPPFVLWFHEHQVFTSNGLFFLRFAHKEHRVFTGDLTPLLFDSMGPMSVHKNSALFLLMLLIGLFTMDAFFSWLIFYSSPYRPNCKLSYNRSD